jgi:hypothetical protein
LWLTYAFTVIGQYTLDHTGSVLFKRSWHFISCIVVFIIFNFCRHRDI